ncbi:MAG TPA: cyclic nucleotide-binding domain-containing protein [Burkholderiales bacterium]|jgi:CRP-like cAMP-binding protein|nr:cyclic nucleotide-binding domain-containing protein [Burkholderiales bacterium]
MAKEHASALRNMELCRALSAAELDTIAAIVERREIAAGMELFREGDAGDGLYLVIAGEVNVIKLGADGEHVLAKLGAGALLGEMSLVTSDARSATGRATAPTVALHVPAAAFRALLDSGSTAALKIARAIAEVLARRLAAMNNLVLGLSSGKAAIDKTTGMKTQQLRELHRTMQVWSF